MICTDKELHDYDVRRTAHQDFTVIDNMYVKQYFFSIDHCQQVTPGGGLPLQYQEGAWVPCSFSLPMSVAPREGIENGIVATIEQYIKVFHPDEQEIANPNPRYIPEFCRGYLLAKLAKPCGHS